MRIKERCTIHVAWGPHPVERECEHCPTGLRSQFLLSHIMRPAAAGDTDSTAHHQEIDDAAIVHVLVVPVVHAGADDHHRPTLRLLRVVCEVARDCDHLLGWHTGDYFLPRRRIGCVVRETLSANTAEAAIETVVRAKKIEHCRHERFAIGERDALARHAAHEHVCTLVVGRETFVRSATEVRECDRQYFVAPVDNAHNQAYFVASLAVLCLEIPASFGLALTRPAIPDRALRHDQSASYLVNRDSFPRSAIRSRQGWKIALPHITVGHIAVTVATQPH